MNRGCPGWFLVLKLLGTNIISRGRFLIDRI